MSAPVYAVAKFKINTWDNYDSWGDESDDDSARVEIVSSFATRHEAVAEARVLRHEQQLLDRLDSVGTQPRGTTVCYSVHRIPAPPQESTTTHADERIRQLDLEYGRRIEQAKAELAARLRTKVHALLDRWDLPEKGNKRCLLEYDIRELAAQLLGLESDDRTRAWLRRHPRRSSSDLLRLVADGAGDLRLG